jgi:hypothetical protein
MKSYERIITDENSNNTDSIKPIRISKHKKFTDTSHKTNSDEVSHTEAINKDFDTIQQILEVSKQLCK